MKVLSDILHKAGILKESADAYSSGGYSVLVRNSTTQKLETVPSSSIVPDQSGNSGKYLTTDGSNLSWGTISTANIYNSDGTLTSNRIVDTGVYQISFIGSGLTASSLTLQPQTLNSSTYKLTQRMASNDYWSIYGYATTADEGDLFFELQDNAAFANGQRFRFHYGNDSSGTPKDILLMDYNKATIDGALLVNGDGQFIKDVNFVNVTIGSTSTRAAGMTWNNVESQFKFQTYDASFPIAFDSSELNFYINFDQKAKLFNSGNLILQNGGTFLDGGERLQVNGTARLNGRTTVSSNGLFVQGGFDSQTGSGLKLHWWSDPMSQIVAYSSSNVSPLTITASVLRLSSNTALSNVTYGESNNTIASGNFGVTGNLNAGQYVKVGYTALAGGLRAVADIGASPLVNNDLILYSNTGQSLYYSSAGTHNFGSLSGATWTSKAILTSAGRLLLGTVLEGTFLLDVNGGVSVKMPSYSSTGFQILNADGVLDWMFYNNGNSPTNGRPFLQVPRWASGTPIQISQQNSNNSGVNQAILIGGGVGNGSVLVNNSIRIGKNSNTVIGVGSIVLGTGNASGAYSISISTEQYGVPVGNVVNDSSFLIGSSWESVTTANFQGILNATNVFIGRPARATSFTGNTAQGVATSINGMGGYGATDATGGNLTINGGVGLGAGASGDVIIGTATPTTTGTTVQTLTDRVWIKGSTGNVGIGATPDALYKLDVNGTFRQTGSTTAVSAIARGAYYTPTLVAAANNDVTVAMDIAPTFTNGAFTGVTNYGLRISASGANPWAIYSSGGNSRNYFGGKVFVGTESGVGSAIMRVAGTLAATVFSDDEGYGTSLSKNYLSLYSGSVTLWGAFSGGGLAIYSGTADTVVGTGVLLSLNSTTKGFRPPRVNSTQKNAISAVSGLQVYDSTLNLPSFYNGTSWVDYGNNIYNSNGTLTGDRTISTATGFKLTLNPKLEVVTTTYNVTAGMLGWSAVNGYVQTSIPASTSFSATGYAFSSLIGNNYMTYEGSATFAADTFTGAVVGINNIAFTAASSTITITQSSSIRTYSAGLYQNTLSGSVNGTITHLSGLAVRPIIRASGTSTITVNNNYGLLIADQNEYGHATITNSWGVYQAGANDNNYFRGKVILGTSNTAGSSVLKINGLPTSASGLATGDIWNNGGVLNVA